MLQFAYNGFWVTTLKTHEMSILYLHCVGEFKNAAITGYLGFEFEKNVRQGKLMIIVRFSFVRV